MGKQLFRKQVNPVRKLRNFKLKPKMARFSNGVNELFEATLLLKSVKECKAFFRDLCTLSEIEDMTERFQVAKMVNNNMSYREVSKKTGLSTATVTRVAHWLHHGMGGYKLVLERMK